MTRKQTVILRLKRSSTGKPWGIRIAGGADLGTPIVVTRVSSFSPFHFIESALLDDTCSNNHAVTPGTRLLLDGTAKAHATGDRDYFLTVDNLLPVS